MVRLPNSLTAFFASIVFFSCNEDPNLQSFPEYKIAIACPCDFKRDTVKVNLLKAREIPNSTCFFGIDSNNLDVYHFDVLTRSEQEYSTEQILSAIDSTLNQNEIEHERRLILSNKAIIINYIRAKELELFTDEFTYYMVVEAKDSLDFKFDKYINSIVFK